MRPTIQPQVYFLRSVSDIGAIKVGYSADPDKRLIAYGKWSPIPLKIVARVPVPISGNRFGDYYGRAYELRFHARYADFRLHHEWFAPHALILGDIEAINAGTFDDSCLPFPGREKDKEAA